MTKRRKPRKPGRYPETDGSVTTVEMVGSVRITTNVLDLAQSHDQRCVQSQRRTVSVGPVVRTNSIPGQNARNKWDYATGQEYETRGQYEAELKRRGLVEMDARDHDRAPETTREQRRAQRQAKLLEELRQVRPPATKQTIRGLGANRDGNYEPLPNLPSNLSPRTSQME